MKPTTEMGTDAATMILRRTADTPWQLSLAREALRVLGRAGASRHEVERDVFRRLTDDELLYLSLAR